MEQNLKVFKYKNRDEIVSKAVNECLRELYEFACPVCNWDEMLEEVKKYQAQQTEEEKHEKRPIELTGADGKRYMFPYDFYYLPMNFQTMVANNYAEAYNVNSVWRDYIETVESYLKNEEGNSVKDVYVKDENGIGHREYEKVPALKDAIGEEAAEKAFELIKNCKDFYRYGYPEENMFRGGWAFRSPNSNRNTVREAWKQVFNKDVEIPDDNTWTDEWDERLEDE